MQRCGGCVMDTSCSQSEVVESMEKEECLDHCRKMDACKLAIYSSDKRCRMTSCPLVYQGKFSNFTLHPVWIKTCRSGNQLRKHKKIFLLLKAKFKCSGISLLGLETTDLHAKGKSKR